MALRRTLLGVALLGAALAGAYEYVSIHKSERHVPAHGPAYVTTFESAPTALDLLLAESDGQFYAAIAEDPLIRHRERWKTRTPEIAYRMQRPMLPYLAWLLSGGRPGAARKALAIVVVLSAGAAAAVAGGLLSRGGRVPALGVAVLLLPGSLIALRGFGPELLAFAFAGGAVLALERGRAGLAVVLLCLAALSRESLTLVGLALGAHALSNVGASHPPIARPARVRRAAALAAAPIATLGAWLVFVRARVGAWPWDASDERIALPWNGFVRGARDWSTPLDAIFAAAALALLVAAFVRARDDRATWIALAFVPLAVAMGWDVWRSWESFGRPLLPLYAFALIAVTAPERRRP